MSTRPYYQDLLDQAKAVTQHKETFAPLSPAQMIADLLQQVSETVAQFPSPPPNLSRKSS